MSRYDAPIGATAGASMRTSSVAEPPGATVTVLALPPGVTMRVTIDAVPEADNGSASAHNATPTSHPIRLVIPMPGHHNRTCAKQRMRTRIGVALLFAVAALSPTVGFTAGAW